MPRRRGISWMSPSQLNLKWNVLKPPERGWGRGQRAEELRQGSCPPAPITPQPTGPSSTWVSSATLVRKSSRTWFLNLFVTLELKSAREGRGRGGWRKAPWERDQTEWKHLWLLGHKPLRTNAPSPTAHPGCQRWKPILSDFGNRPSPRGGQERSD